MIPSALRMLLDQFTDRDDDSEAGPTPGRKSAHKALTGLVVCLVLVLAMAAGAWIFVDLSFASKVDRLPSDPFQGLADRPARATGTAAKAVNILLLGTDRRSDVATTGDDAKAPAWARGAQRSDTMMLLHIDGDRQAASVVSIPRDSWVDIPGKGKGKVNWAYSYGGPQLAVETFEQLTDLHVDHVAVVDWDGFIALTDAVGGVDVDIPSTVTDSARHITWPAGRRHLDGEQALDYVGERYGLPGGDLDRVARQQAFLRTLMQTALEQELKKEPTKLYRFVTLMLEHISVDQDWGITDMTELMVSMRNTRSADIRYLTVPVRGTGRVGDQSVVRLAPAVDDELWTAVREDRMDQWSAINWERLTPDVVN